MDTLFPTCINILKVRSCHLYRHSLNISRALSILLLFPNLSNIVSIITMDSTDPIISTESEFEAWRDSQWQLAEVLSNPKIENDIFTVEERTKDGKITYQLPLNDFLGIENKKAVRGKGFCESQCTKDIHQDSADPYSLKFEARSQPDGNDWSAMKCNLRDHLRLNHGILFAGDVAPAMLLEKSEEDISNPAIFEVSAAQSKEFVEYDIKEKHLMDGIDAESMKQHKSHPDHELVFQPGPAPGQVVANFWFKAGAKVGQMINRANEPNRHPGNMKYRTDGKGHMYFGCELHEHDIDGKWKSVCTTDTKRDHLWT